MVFSTPWGSADSCLEVLPGAFIVSTASHGGLMFTDNAAKEILSAQARSVGFKECGHLCFEEDCQVAVPLFDSDKLRRAARDIAKWYSGKSTDEMKEEYRQNISSFYPEYLIAIGEEPDPVAYNNYLLRREEDKRRKQKDPDVIICAWGAYKTFMAGVVTVQTADGKIHYVTEDSYNKRSESPERSILNPLSACEIVDRSSFPSLRGRAQEYIQYCYDRFTRVHGDCTSDSLRLRLKKLLNSTIAELAYAIVDEEGGELSSVKADIHNSIESIGLLKYCKDQD